MKKAPRLAGGRARGWPLGGDPADPGAMTPEDRDQEVAEILARPSNFRETVVDALGNETLFEYDQRGNVITDVDALGGVVRREYNFNNNMTSETLFPNGDDPADPNDGHTTLFTYDGRGNVLTETDPLGHVTDALHGDGVAL